MNKGLNRGHDNTCGPVDLYELQLSLCGKLINLGSTDGQSARGLIDSDEQRRWI
jgi:hypothetical protein